MRTNTSRSIFLKSIFAACVALSAACTDGADTNVERFVSIGNGVYGQTTTFDDVGNNSVEPHSMMLRIEHADGHTDSVAPKSVTSDSRGFYELAVGAGSYRICTTFDRCESLTISTDQLWRCDYELGPGPGWNCAAR